MEPLSHVLPHVNATLNAAATVLLVAGFYAIRSGRIRLHRNVMLSCFLVSAVFLGCYLLHKFALYETTGMPNKTFPRDTNVASETARMTYFAVLGTHLVAAILVPPLAITAIFLGLTDRRATHRRVVRFAYPIWLYVSVTGVVVYFMLYQIYVPPAS